MGPLNRRSFLTGFAAAAIAPALPKASGIPRMLTTMIDPEVCVIMDWDLAAGESYNGFGYVTAMVDENARQFSRYQRLAYCYDVKGISFEEIAARTSQYWDQSRLPAQAGPADRGNERLDRLAHQSRVPSESARDGLRRYLAGERVTARDQASDQTLATQFRPCSPEACEILRDGRAQAYGPAVGVDLAEGRLQRPLPTEPSNEGCGAGDHYGERRPHQVNREPAPAGSRRTGDAVGLGGPRPGYTRQAT